MKNETRKVSDKIIQYKQNELEVLLTKDEARKCASELILIASEILDFTGDANISRIVYSADSMLDIKF